MTYNAAGHQRAIEMHWRHLLGALMLSIIIYSQWPKQNLESLHVEVDDDPQKHTANVAKNCSFM